jgi:hypothetical protein
MANRDRKDYMREFMRRKRAAAKDGAPPKAAPGTEDVTKPSDKARALIREMGLAKALALSDALENALEEEQRERGPIVGTRELTDDELRIRELEKEVERLRKLYVAVKPERTKRKIYQHAFAHGTCGLLPDTEDYDAPEWVQWRAEHPFQWQWKEVQVDAAGYYVLNNKGGFLRPSPWFNPDGTRGTRRDISTDRRQNGVEGPEKTAAFDSGRANRLSDRAR